MKQSAYKMIYGMGVIICISSAREPSRELGLLQQFSSNKHLYRFLVLNPSKSSSGEQRSISRCGRPRLGHLLTEESYIAAFGLSPSYFIMRLILALP